jgi:hypothetical protein
MVFAAVAAVEVAELVTGGKNRPNLTKPKRSRIGFKAG